MSNINKHGFTVNQISELNDSGMTRELDIESHVFNGLFNTSKVKAGSRLNLQLGIYKCMSYYRQQEFLYYEEIFQWIGHI